jgi:hypothetical protein
MGLQQLQDLPVDTVELWPAHAQSRLRSCRTRPEIALTIGISSPQRNFVAPGE